MNQLKTYIKTSVFTVVVLLALSSCKKSFLEINPKGKLIASATADYNLLLNNEDLFNIYSSVQVLLSDEVASTETYFSSAPVSQQRTFRWEADIYDESEDASEFSSPLKSLYTYNKIISEVPASEGGTETQKNAILAEAKAGRAWTYFLLINSYGKPYVAATAPSDPGFPILRTANVINNAYTRASVQEVYDFIIDDLKSAIPLLPATVSHRTRMSKAAAEGILAKVYIFMGRFDEALPLLNAAFTDLAGSSVPVRLYNYNTALAAGGAFYPGSSFSGPAYPLLIDNEESILARQFNNTWGGFNNMALLKRETVELFSPSDLRLQFFSNAPMFETVPFANKMMRRLGPSNCQFGVLLPELYLLRAECKARLNDGPGAVADLEFLRSNRIAAAGEIPVPNSAKADRVSLLRFVMDERIREFALEGFRWYDMRRLSVDPLFTNQQYSHTLFLTNGGTTIFTLAPERLTLRLPLKVLRMNAGMPENP